jgi:chemotaxis protein CheX
MLIATDPLTLRQETLSAFVCAIMHYFDHMAGIPATTETPYLLEGVPEVMDYTSVIGISGYLQGCIYYTAPRHMVDRLLRLVHEPEPTDELRCDMVGEVANTLSGNARRQLGSGFMISTPVVMQGKPDRIAWPKATASFGIPILWQDVRSLLMVCLADGPAM